MAFFSQPSGGADTAGGLFPTSEIQVCRNRSGSDLDKGAVVCLDMTGLLAAIDPTDGNAAIPGGGDTQSDTVWNTVRSPNANHIDGDIPTLFGVLLQPLANGSAGRVQFFGIVDEANVIDTAAAGVPWGFGDPLSVTPSNSFDRVVTASDRVIGSGLFANENVTNSARRRRVMLHNGVGFASGDITTPVT